MRTPEQQANFDLVSATVERVAEKCERQGHDLLSQAERTVYAVWWVEAEVNNGGFHQYFCNSAGDHHRDAVDGLTRIGAPRMADVVRRAVEVFPTPPARDSDARFEQIEALPEEALEQLEGLDQDFYAYPEDLEFLLADFIRRDGSL